MNLQEMGKYNLVFKKTVTMWDEAIPLGNGLSGALIWGSPRQLRFSLDRVDIWDETTEEGAFSEQFSYADMVRLAGEGKSKEIHKIYCEPYDKFLLPTKLPAGKIIFDFRCDDNVYSELKLAQAEAQITIGERIHINSYLHATKKVGMIRIDQSSETFSYRIENPAYSVKGMEKPEKSDTENVPSNATSNLFYDAPEVVAEGNTRYFVQRISEEFEYGIFTMFKELEGAVEIAYLVRTSADGENWKEDSLAMLADALEQGYADMIESHLDWWEEYWEKSSITVPDLLFEKNWYISQYFLASCSRKGCYPMPLQGVWTADNDQIPPWKGDYHGDLNLQMSYFSYLKANHIEEGECITDYLEKMIDCGREFAKSFFGTNGLCLPSVMSLSGKPLGGYAQYSFSPTNQIWTAQILERHYRFTGDRSFLEEKAYPYLKETAEMILGILEKRDGMYYLPISSSPEIHGDEQEAFLTPNSNYDLALMRYLFDILAKLALELGNGEEKRWSEVSDSLPELAVNEGGVLMLSPDEELKESHRHMSHCMAIHPLHLIKYDTQENKRIIDNTIRALERLGSGLWVGYSFPWIAEFYAVAKNGNGAAANLEKFWRYFCSQNGFHLNGDYKQHGCSAFHYRPFTLEGNFCAADALQEMLLQSEDNLLECFPAVPETWLEETVAFTDFRAEKGLLVSAVMEQGQVVSLTLKPQFTGEVYLVKNEKNEALIFQMERAVDIGKDMVKLMLYAGEEYSVSTK